MTSDVALAAVLDALNELGIRYTLTGSLASNFYGISRSTKDADFVVEFAGTELSALAARLPKGLRLDPQMSFETVTGTMRYVILNTDTAYKVELFLLSNDPHDQERLRRRRLVSVNGRDVYITSGEDVLITKVRWSKLQNRSKDRDDIINVLSMQRGDALDWTYIERWCREHGTWELLQEIRTESEKLR